MYLKTSGQAAHRLSKLGKRAVLLAVLVSAQASALTLTPVALGLAGKDADYVYGLVIPKSGSPVTEAAVTLGRILIKSQSVMFCDEYSNQGILNDSYVIKHKTFQVVTDASIREEFNSTKQNDWAFGAILGCIGTKQNDVGEETFYIPVSAPSFLMPYPLSDFKAKIINNQNLQISVSITPK